MHLSLSELGVSASQTERCAGTPIRDAVRSANAKGMRAGRVWLVEVAGWRATPSDGQPSRGKGSHAGCWVDVAREMPGTAGETRRLTRCPTRDLPDGISLTGIQDGVHALGVAARRIFARDQE